jgi:hypothetical protein
MAKPTPEDVQAFQQYLEGANAHNSPNTEVKINPIDEFRNELRQAVTDTLLDKDKSISVTPLMSLFKKSLGQLESPTTAVKIERDFWKEVVIALRKNGQLEKNILSKIHELVIEAKYSEADKWIDDAASTIIKSVAPDLHRPSDEYATALIYIKEGLRSILPEDVKLLIRDQGSPAEIKLKQAKAEKAEPKEQAAGGGVATADNKGGGPKKNDREIMFDGIKEEFFASTLAKELTEFKFGKKKKLGFNRFSDLADDLKSLAKLAEYSDIVEVAKTISNQPKNEMKGVILNSVINDLNKGMEDLNKMFPRIPNNYNLLKTPLVRFWQLNSLIVKIKELKTFYHLD